MKHIKCVLLGDRHAGKTCLLNVFNNNNFPKNNFSTVYDTLETPIMVNGKQINLGICDTNGSEAYEQFRCLQYPLTDVFIICFSLLNPVSLSNLKLKWLPEIKRHCPRAPIILVGTKMDLRYGQFSLKEKNESHAKGLQVAKEIQAFSYRECSALSNIGVQQVFLDAVKAARSSKKGQKTCHIV